MGFRTPDLAYFGVFRGIKSSTFKYFGVGSTFGPPFGHFVSDPGSGGRTQTTAK